ncbi:hypothetical protein ACFSHT_09000 [Paraburkholderia silviterrae]|uniref:Uncharacterized protein n=1 Tax=Paraburkholderia silviterrae TaxID=2528715 RepID=A0A4R5MDG2_9BURK|nr:hypothetical protein [Paraburkholderia silviterrae]TDG25130.1 hypothetical protein EYW47_04510 [Paraburkholderia silviterrae]
MSDSPMKSHVFAVLDEPYCVWEHPEDNNNLEFLNGIDPAYFSFVAERMRSTEASAEEDRRAATALRSTYHHALETFFSLVGALVQAPTCVYGWLAQCSTPTLRTLVEQISENRFSSPNVVQGAPVTWETISAVVHGRMDVSEPERARVISGFADLWARSALLFLRRENIDEYNSLKHGFRVHAGGFQLSMDVAANEQVGAPTTKFDLGGSKYGSRYLLIERIGGTAKSNRSFIPRRHYVNWSAEQTSLLLVLLSASIRNVVTFLKLLNGGGDQTNSACPTDDEFQAPWGHTVGVVRMDLARKIPDWAVSATTRQNLDEHLATIGFKRATGK